MHAMVSLIILLAISPFEGLADRVSHAFAASVSWLVVALVVAIPWIALFLLMSWLSLRFLRWWVKKKREAKAKRNDSHT